MRVVVTDAGAVRFFRRSETACEYAAQVGGKVFRQWRSWGALAAKNPAKVMLAYRTANGLTQAQAAEEFGVARNTWARWERGEVIPNATALILLAERAERAGLFVDGGE